jgi:hypothetical protein
MYTPCADQYGLSREDQDEFAASSQLRRMRRSPNLTRKNSTRKSSSLKRVKVAGNST